MRNQPQKIGVGYRSKLRIVQRHILTNHHASIESDFPRFRCSLWIDNPVCCSRKHFSRVSFHDPLNLSAVCFYRESKSMNYFRIFILKSKASIRRHRRPIFHLRLLTSKLNFWISRFCFLPSELTEFFNKIKQLSPLLYISGSHYFRPCSPFTFCTSNILPIA